MSDSEGEATMMQLMARMNNRLDNIDRLVNDVEPVYSSDSQNSGEYTPRVQSEISNLPIFKIASIIFYADKLLSLASPTQRIKWTEWKDSPFGKAFRAKFELDDSKFDIPKMRH